MKPVSERKSSTKVVTFDLNDPELRAKHVRITAAIFAVLFQMCDGPEEAYAILHQAQELLSSSYDIGEMRTVTMQTDKLQ